MATNEDPTHPTPDGPAARGGGAAGRGGHRLGRHPRVAGKPHAPIADLWEAASVAPVGTGRGREVTTAHRRRLAERLACLRPGRLRVTAPGTGGFDVPVAVRYQDFATLVRSVLD